MKQIERTKRHRGRASGRQEPLAIDWRDPDIVRAHRIARRGGRPGVERVWSGRRGLAAPVSGR